MQNKTFEILSNKLKNAPDDIFDSVNGYIDGLLVTKLNTINLSAEQQALLDEQVNLEKSLYFNAEKLHDALVKKYEL